MEVGMTQATLKANPLVVKQALSRRPRLRRERSLVVSYFKTVNQITMDLAEALRTQTAVDADGCVHIDKKRMADRLRTLRIGEALSQYANCIDRLASLCPVEDVQSHHAALVSLHRNWHGHLFDSTEKLAAIQRSPAPELDKMHAVLAVVADAEETEKQARAQAQAVADTRRSILRQFAIRPSDLAG
jgi:hypothetical protein